jgi:peptide/nickel transport system permease protein
VRRRLAARLVQSIVVTYVVATIAFFVIHAAPGDPISYSARPIPPETQRELREEFAWNKPASVQYLRYLANASHGNFGYSYIKQKRVSTVLADAVPRTLLLAGISLIISVVLGALVGVMQAVKGGWFDRGANAVLLFFYSLPDFWGALMILTVFASWWRLFPAGGIVNPVMYEYWHGWRAFADRLAHLALPVLSLTILSLAAITRYQRAAMLDVLPAEFIRAARAKGVSERAIVWRHALRNALTPMVTILGLMLPGYLGGAVFVERVFSWPGLGLLATEAIGGHDYDLVTATVVVGAVIVLVGNLLADMLQVALDPRVRE